MCVELLVSLLGNSWQVPTHNGLLLDWLLSLDPDFQGQAADAPTSLVFRARHPKPDSKEKVWDTGGSGL